MDLSYQEKSIWVSLIAIAFAYTYYFSQVLDGGAATAGDVIALMAGIVILLVIVEVVFHVALTVPHAVQGDDDPDRLDERDRLFADKAARNGYYFLSVGVFIAIGHIVFGSWVSDAEITPRAYDPLVAAHLLVFAGVLAESVKLASQLFYYRRGN